ncbi:MAG: cation transporter, partial [Parasporobacterium sp.]|nr:cation transporter [Parasporobacterium sp.]
MNNLRYKKESQNSSKIAVKVSVVSIIGNLILTFFKLFAGIFAHSGAMVSDAIHSASDVVSSIVVIIGVKISEKKEDEDHPYGHERFESVAAIILSVMLVVVGGGIGLRAVQSIINGSYLNMEVPGMLALIASGVSIVSKTAMFFYTRKNAKKIQSPALKADAWHHLSDALSSVGALIGIGGAMLGVAVMEPIASAVICIMILKAAADIFIDAMNQMLDKSAGEEIEQEIRDCAEKQEGVLGVDLLHTRMFGNKIYVDIEICLDRNLTLEKAHAIAETVHAA